MMNTRITNSARLSAVEAGQARIEALLAQIVFQHHTPARVTDAVTEAPVSAPVKRARRKATPFVKADGTVRMARSEAQAASWAAGAERLAGGVRSTGRPGTTTKRTAATTRSAPVRQACGHKYCPAGACKWPSR